MKTALAAALFMAACGPSDRERDCEQVRALLVRPDMPRRYYDYTAKPVSAEARNESVFDQLRKLELRDPEVRDAVRDLVSETGWTFYTPYDTGRPPSAAERLGQLCKLPRTRVETN